MKAVNKTEHVYRWIRSQIEELRFSNQEKLPSENMICRHFSVSRVTVRNALNRLEEEGLIYRVKGSGTYINKEAAIGMEMPRGSGQRKIALILQGQDTRANSSFIRGIEEHFPAEEMDLHTFFTDNKFVNERLCLQAIIDCGYDGLIVDGVRANIMNPNLDCYRKLYRMQVPVIFYNNFYPELKYPSVGVDDLESGRLLMSALLEAGHRNILGFFVVDNYKSIEKFRGSVNGLKRYGLEFDDDDIIWSMSTEAHDPAYMKTIERLLKARSRTTAIICCNDIIYRMIKDVIAKMGKRVPEDYSLVCFDYSGDDWVEEDVYCTVERGKTIGRLVMQKLMDMIELKNFKQYDYSEVIKPRLYEGRSIRTLS